MEGDVWHRADLMVPFYAKLQAIKRLLCPEAVTTQTGRPYLWRRIGPG